jgi:hypothetical protein
MSEKNGLSLEEKATNYATMQHIARVQHFLHLFAKALLDRSELHDQSKLESPEVELFTEFTPKLAGSTYGSAEYEGFRKAMGPALQHHYAKNRHHPEHFPDQSPPEVYELLAQISDLKEVRESKIPESRHYVALTRSIERLEHELAVAKSSVGGMNLVDLVEMFCDWKAATERHDDGNIKKSIDHNKKRFGLAEQVARLLHNTVELVER